MFLYLATPVISEALLVLEDLVSSVMHERAKSKAIMYKSISGIIDVTISLFSIYLNKLGMYCAVYYVSVVRKL